MSSKDQPERPISPDKKVILMSSDATTDDRNPGTSRKSQGNNTLDASRRFPGNKSPNSSTRLTTAKSLSATRVLSNTRSTSNSRLRKSQGADTLDDSNAIGNKAPRRSQGDKITHTDGSRRTSGGPRRSKSSTTQFGGFQEDENAKVDLLKQIEVLKGDLERRSSRTYTNSESNDDTYHRRESRRSSVSSVESAGTKDSRQKSDDNLLHDRGNLGVRKHHEKHKTETFFTKITGMFADMDAIASRAQTPRHDACIYLSLFLIPILAIIFIWDLFAILVFEIPHLSMIEHPGFMLLFHFIGVPTSMYGYMMRVLMGLDKTPLTTLGVISVGLHPAFLCLRAFIEIYFEGFQSQQLVRYENYSP